MKVLPRYLALLLVTPWLLALTPATCHQDVRFKHGASSATYSGQVSGYDVCEYTFGAVAGQRLSVTLSGKHSNRLEAHLVDPGQEVGLWREVSLNTSGQHAVRVSMPRALARRGYTVNYRVSISIH